MWAYGGDGAGIVAGGDPKRGESGTLTAIGATDQTIQVPAGSEITEKGTVCIFEEPIFLARLF